MVAVPRHPRGWHAGIATRLPNPDPFARFLAPDRSPDTYSLRALNALISPTEQLFSLFERLLYVRRTKMVNLLELERRVSDRRTEVERIVRQNATKRQLRSSGRVVPNNTTTRKIAAWLIAALTA